MMGRMEDQIMAAWDDAVEQDRLKKLVGILDEMAEKFPEWRIDRVSLRNAGTNKLLLAQYSDGHEVLLDITDLTKELVLVEFAQLIMQDKRERNGQ